MGGFRHLILMNPGCRWVLPPHLQPFAFQRTLDRRNRTRGSKVTPLLSLRTPPGKHKPACFSTLTPDADVNFQNSPPQYGHSLSNGTRHSLVAFVVQVLGWL